MFAQTWGWIKSNPYTVLAIVGALALIYIVFSRGSTAGTGMAVYGPASPSDAAIASAAQVQVAQMQAGLAAGQTSAQLEAIRTNNATEISIAQIQASVANYQTEQAANIQTLNIGASRDIQLQGIQSQQIIQMAAFATQAQIEANRAATDQKRIESVVAIANAPYELQKTQITTLGSQGLTTVLKRALEVRGSSINIGGISAGRGNSSGGGFGDILGGILGGIAAII